MTPKQFERCYGRLRAPLWLVAHDGRLTAANSAALRRLDAVPGQLLADHLSDPPEAVRRLIAVCLRHGWGQATLHPADAGALRCHATRLDGQGWGDAPSILVEGEAGPPAEKLELLGLVACGAAHDLNNLLAVILGLARTIGRQAPAQARQAGEILLAGRRSAEMVRLVLDLAREKPAASRRVELDHAVGELAPLLRRLLPREIELQTSADPGCPIEIDPPLVDQIVLNLSLNARDAMPDGGRLALRCGAVEIDADAAPALGLLPGPYALLEVADTGDGIDPGLQRRVFEPFYTTKPPGRGTGLGLALVERIVRDHRGAIALDSRPGEGATFRIYLPCCANVRCRV